LSKTDISFDDFLVNVNPQYRGFAMQTHEAMLQGGCKLKLTPAKSGYVVSYAHGKSKRVIMNFVFRKKGLSHVSMATLLGYTLTFWNHCRRVC
jgi:hypothetical protein